MAKSYFKIKSWAEKIALAAAVGGVFAPKALAQFDAGEVKPIPVANSNPIELITSLVNYLLWIVGILAVLYLIYGGVIYLTAGGDAEKAGKGRVAITNAIIGIVIIAAALAIYNLIWKGLNA